MAYTEPNLFLLVSFTGSPFKVVGSGERAWDQELMPGLISHKLFTGSKRIHFLPLDPVSLSMNSGRLHISCFKIMVWAALGGF